MEDSVQEFKSKFNKNEIIWLERELKKGYSKNDVVPTLEYFLANKPKFKEKDIFKHDARELEDVIKEGVISKSDQRKLSRGKHKILKETDDFLLVRVDDQQAAEFWGKDTKWCITMSDTDHFDSYRNSNVVFYVCVNKRSKKNTKYCRVCICISRNSENEMQNYEIYNAQDEVVTKSKLPKKMREFLK